MFFKNFRSSDGEGEGCGVLVGVWADAVDMLANMMTSRAARRDGLRQIVARCDFIRYSVGADVVLKQGDKSFRYFMQRSYGQYRTRLFLLRKALLWERQRHLSHTDPTEEIVIKTHG